MSAAALAGPLDAGPTLLPNLKSARFGSCPGLTIKERTAPALAWHGGHWPSDWYRTHTYGRYIRSKTFLGLLCTFFIMIYHWYTFGIISISPWCTLYINGISLYKKVWTKPRNVLLCIYQPYVWGLHITGKYLVYTLHIPCKYQSGGDITVIAGI